MKLTRSQLKRIIKEALIEEAGLEVESRKKQIEDIAKFVYDFSQTKEDKANSDKAKFIFLDLLDKLGKQYS